MATTAFVPGKQLEDPLAHLPRTQIVEYTKGQLIYNQDEPADFLFLIISGRVRVSRLTPDGAQVLVKICQQDEFFGESALLRVTCRGEKATAMEDVRVMTWTGPAIEDRVMRQPRLAVALLQILTQQTMELSGRIKAFAADSIQQRLARALLDFSERLGNREDNGGICMGPLSHELLSQYVGTSREVVTHYMNQFRRQGCLQYSRKAIIVFDRPLLAWLRENAAGRVQT